MPLSSTTISELKCAVARLDFLLTVSNVKLKKIIPDTKCSICQEVFNKDGWRFGETANAPVKLNCGHVLGIQCLARLVYSTDFSNRCPLCRAQVISDTYEQNPSNRAWEVATPLLRVLTGLDRQLAALVKKETLDLLNNTLPDWAPVEGKHMNRTMILYEEFVNRFCDHPQAANDNDRATRAEQRAEELRELLDMQTRIHDLSEEAARDHAAIAQSREELIEALQKQQKDALEGWGTSIEKLKETARALEEARGTIFPRAGSMLFGIVSTTVVIYIWSLTWGGSREVFVTTMNTAIGLFGFLVVITATCGTSWEVAFLRGAVPVGFLALAYWNANAV